MSLNDLVNGGDEDIDVSNSLDSAVTELSKINSELEDMALNAVEVVEALDNNGHDLHWTEVDAAESLWENLDDMVDRHKSAVQKVDNVRREI